MGKYTHFTEGKQVGARKSHLYDGIMQNWSIPTSLKKKRIVEMIVDLDTRRKEDEK